MELSLPHTLEAELVVPVGLPNALPLLETDQGSPAGWEMILPHYGALEAEPRLPPGVEKVQFQEAIEAEVGPPAGLKQI